MTASETKPTVYFVDHDAAILDAAAALFKSHEIHAELFTVAEEFLERFSPALSGCVVCEMHLQPTTGFDLHSTLHTRGSMLPMVFTSAKPDVRGAVEAMKRGAVTFLEKPYPADELIDAVRVALQIDARSRETLIRHAEVRRRLELLTPRERQLAMLICDGKTNKHIARTIRACERTVERLRANVFETMGVESAAKLAKILVGANLIVSEEETPAADTFRILHRSGSPLRPLQISIAVPSVEMESLGAL